MNATASRVRGDLFDDLTTVGALGLLGAAHSRDAGGSSPVTDSDGPGFGPLAAVLAAATVVAGVTLLDRSR